MAWLMGILLACLFLLLLLLSIPREVLQDLIKSLRSDKETLAHPSKFTTAPPAEQPPPPPPARRLFSKEPDAAPGPSRRWQAEVDDPEERKKQWQERSRRVMQGIMESKSSEQESLPATEKKEGRRKPGLSLQESFLVRILAIAAVVGLIVLVAFFINRQRTPERPHRLTIALADLSMSPDMSSSRAGARASQDLSAVIETALGKAGLTETVKLQLLSSTPETAEQAQRYAQTNAADLLIWGWTPPEGPPRYVLTMTINLRVDREVPEFDEYAQLMMTPPQFSLNQAGRENWLSQTEITRTVIWLSHFYLGEYELVERQPPNTIPRTGLSFEIFQFHWAALYWLRGDYVQAQTSYDLLFPENTLVNCQKIKPGELCAAASNNQAVVLITREALGQLRPTALNQAIRLLQQATYIRPDALVSRYNLGRAYLGRGMWPEASRELATVVQYDRNHGSALAALSEAYRRQGDLGQARDKAQEALRVDPSLPLARLALGRVYLSSGDLKAATRELQRAMELTEAEGKARRSRGTALREGPDPNLRRAAYAFAWADRNDPTLAQVHLAQAELYLRMGVVEGKPSIFVFLWRALTRQPDPMDQSLQEIIAALGKHENWYDALYLQGRIYLAMGQPGQAASSFKSAREQDDSKIEAYLGLAEALRAEWKLLQAAGQAEEALAKMEEARQEYLQLIRKDIDPARGHFGLGEVAQENGQWEAARQAFADAVNERPEYAEAYLRLGQVNLQMGNEGPALSNLQEAINKASGGEWWIKLEAYTVRGQIFLEKYLRGKTTGAAEPAFLDSAGSEFAKGQQINGNEPRVLNGLGRVAYERGEFLLAQNLYQKALKLQRNNFDTLYGLGQVYEAQEKSRSALEYFDQALSQNPRSIAARYHLGVAYFAQLNESKSRELLEQVQQMCQERPEEEQTADDQESCQRVDSWLEDL